MNTSDLMLMRGNFAHLMNHGGHTAVFLHAVQNTVIFVGTCKVYQLMSPPEIINSPTWRKHAEGVADLVVQVDSIHQKPNEAASVQRKLVIQYRPVVNMEDIKSNWHGANVMILCNETGERFRTQREVCLKYGLDPGNVSRILRGLGKSTRGYSFRYDVDDPFADG